MTLSPVNETAIQHFFESSLTQRLRELQFRSLTMEAPPFSSSCSSSPLSSKARLLSSPSSSSSLLFRHNSFSKTHYSAKFKSPRNLSVRASGDSGTLSLFFTQINFKLSDNCLINFFFFFNYNFEVVTLLDYGAGNVRSVRNAIRYLGFDIKDVIFFTLFFLIIEFTELLHLATISLCLN